MTINVLDHPVTIWNADMVGERMIEAFETLRAIPSSGGGSAWPAAIIYTFDDKTFQEETRDKKAWAWTRVKPSPSPQAISRMNDCLEWPNRYLRNHEGASRCLLLWAITRAYRRSIEKKLRARRWSRSTFERKRREGCQLIANGLNKDRVVAK